MANSSIDIGMQSVKKTSGFVRACRKVYNPLGFKKGYNFPLFVILVGALLGFVLARFQFMDVNGRFFPVCCVIASLLYLSDERSSKSYQLSSTGISLRMPVVLASPYT